MGVKVLLGIWVFGTKRKHSNGSVKTLTHLAAIQTELPLVATRPAEQVRAPCPFQLIRGVCYIIFKKIKTIRFNNFKYFSTNPH